MLNLICVKQREKSLSYHPKSAPLPLGKSVCISSSFVLAIEEWEDLVRTRMDQVEEKQVVNVSVHASKLIN